jgi:hypothetical protein
MEVGTIRPANVSQEVTMHKPKRSVLVVLLSLLVCSGCAVWKAALDSPSSHNDSKGVHESKPYATMDPRNE